MNNDQGARGEIYTLEFGLAVSRIYKLNIFGTALIVANLLQTY